MGDAISCLRANPAGQTEGNTAMTSHDILSSVTSIQRADSANPIPAGNLTATADLAIRAALALMPFSAIAWLFIAH